MRAYGRWVMAVMAVLWLAAAAARAGSLDSPAGTNSAASAMYTVTDIYNRLDTGAAGAKRTGSFVEPSGAPGSTGRTLDEIMAKAPVVTAGAASQPNVLGGRTFWGLGSGGAWGPKTGSMPNNGAVGITPTTTTQIIPAGYHDGSGSVAGDADLVSGNIRAGQNIFGVAGNANVVNTSSGDATAGDILSGKKAWVDGSELTGTAPAAAVPRTGQVGVYQGGDDGTYLKGVAWPTPRFTDNGDGTVTDNLTKLMWAKNTSLWGAVTWSTAINNCEALTLGPYNDWRLPNVRELQSLIDYGSFSPSLPVGHPFTGVVVANYWSSTTYAANTTYALYVFLYAGTMDGWNKGATYYVWPVRGGQ